MVDKASGYAVYQLGGTAQASCRVRLSAQGKRLPTLRVSDEAATTNEPFSPIESDKRFEEYHVPGNARLRVDWSVT